MSQFSNMQNATQPQASSLLVCTQHYGEINYVPRNGRQLQQMEQYKSSERYSILRQINHKKMHSFQLSDKLEELERSKDRGATLKSSKSSVDLRNHQKILDLDIEQKILPQVFLKNNVKKITIRPEDKENKHTFFIRVYNHKISKLITSNTAQQKERYMRKLNQALADDAFRAIGYQFDSSYVRYINEFLLNSQITKIVLDNNPLGDGGVIKLTAVLPKLRLKELSLASVNMSNYGASVLFITLKEVPTLLKLNVSTGESINKNKLSSEGAEPLKLLLNSNSCVIDTLQMNHLRLGSEGARIAFEGVTSSSLESLSLSKNDIGIKSINVLTQSLARIPLMRLDLSKNNIQDTGIKCLTDILGLFYSKNIISMNLSYLNLSNNAITSQGFEFFCREMGVNRTLETLILDDNPLGEGDRFFNIKYYLSKNWGLKKLSLCNISPCEKDLKFICEGVESNRSLEELTLSKNQIDGEMLSFVFLMLTKNKSLRHIVMNNCKISDNHLLKNEHMIGSCFTAIEEIDLENNYINIKGAQILKKIINTNQNILKLSLIKNCIPETSIDEINDILKENESKRPFEHELNYFESVFDLYEDKKKALKGEVQKIKKYQEKLQTHLLAEEIEFNLTLEENLKKKIVKEQTRIRSYQASMLLKVVDIDEDGSNFLTSPKSK